MIDQNSVDRLSAATVRGPDGSEIGTVEQVYLDDRTGQPEWVTVRTGSPAGTPRFVPLAGADLRGDELIVLVVDVDVDTVSGAPQVADDGHLSEQQTVELYRYYGLAPAGDDTEDTSRTDEVTQDRGTGSGVEAPAGTADRGGSAPTADTAMTRSEERLTVSTEQVVAGTVRLRKYVVTEIQTVEVPVRREEVRLVREPISDTDRGAVSDGTDFDDPEFDVSGLTEDGPAIVLHAERPVVTTETVPVERVRLDKQTVTDTETVTGEVRKEKIELDDPTGTAQDTTPQS